MSQKSNDVSRRNPIHRNEGFTCEFCHYINQKAAKTCRNHCCKCLYSKHVDASVPGDRQSNCLGLMKAIALEDHHKKDRQLVYECLMCGHQTKNKIADDDKIEALIAITQSQNRPLLKKSPKKSRHTRHA